jgi:hypothetical protein
MKNRRQILDRQLKNEKQLPNTMYLAPIRIWILSIAEVQKDPGGKKPLG